MSVERIFAAMPIRFPAKFARLFNIFSFLAITLGTVAGIGIVFLNKPLYALAAVAGLVVFLLALYSEEFGLLVLVFISYSRFSDILIDYHGLISFAKPFLVVLVVTILIRWAVFGERPKGWEQPAILFGLMSLTGLFSLFYSPVPDRVWARWIDDIKDTVIALVVVILLQKGPVFRRVLWTLIFLGLFMGSLSVYQYATKTFDNDYGGFAVSQKHQIVGAIDDYRSTGPVEDANFFAQILVVLVCISLERFLHEKKFILRLLALSAFVVTFLTVLLTYSRGGFVAMLVGILIVFIYYPPKTYHLPIIIITGVVFVSLLPPNYMDRILTLQEFFKPRPTSRIEEASFQGRLSENLTAVEMIQSNPLFGVGLNSYKYLFPTYSKKLGLALVATEREAHSLYLEVTAETGIIGLLVLLLLLYTCLSIFLKARKQFLNVSMKNYAGMVTGFMAGWLGYLVAAAFIHNGYPRFFYLLMGLALAVRMVAKNTAIPEQVLERDL
jgi:putative inorganic carbon (hco3(-)) transporter